MDIKAITKNLINLIYPLHCASCERPLDPLDKNGVCESCLAHVRRNPKPYCERCGRSIDETGRICAECRRTRPCFDRAFSACLYEGSLKEIIHRFKYNGILSLGAVLSGMMKDFVTQNLDITDGIDMMTYVPLQNNRMRKRGFNQSLILGAFLSKESGIPIFHALVKARSTRHQNELSRDERLVNLDGAFKLKRGADVKEMRILLIDDVMTTGATLSECAKVMKNAGAREVRCLTLARGV